jgi:hypothetical protein
MAKVTKKPAAAAGKVAGAPKKVAAAGGAAGAAVSFCIICRIYLNFKHRCFVLEIFLMHCN